MSPYGIDSGHQWPLSEVVAYRDELRDALNLIPKEDSAYKAAEMTLRGLEDEVTQRLSRLIRDNVVIPKK